MVWHRRSAMGDAAPRTWTDCPTYLALERDTDRRHEWLDGQVWAMAGGTTAHSHLSAQMIVELARLLGERSCRVFTSDQKIRVPATGLATYADTLVVCGELLRDADDRNALINPVVIVEVLSDSTETYDRGDKFAHYKRLASLRDYVLVSLHDARIEVYSRAEGRRWIYQDAGPGEQVPLTAVEGLLDVDRVYRGVELDPAPRSTR